MRPVMEEAYRDLSKGLIPLVVAPTGYGKTRASPEIYERAKSEGIAGGLVHVAPLRSLVRKIYEDNFRDYGGAYQMHVPFFILHDKNESLVDKSPYLLRELVVTTLDSFTLNMYRIPVLESLKIESGLSLGHYYPVYTGVLSSVVVFDEAHLYLSEDEPGQGVTVETLRALVGFLAAAGSSLIVETATMKPSTLKRIAGVIQEAGRQPIVRTLACPQVTPYQKALEDALSGTARIEPVKDVEWLVENESHKWETRVLRDWGEAVPLIRERARDGKVLVVANTVRTAIRLHEELGGVLIHGRLTSSDRNRVEKALSGKQPGIIISTQVIEAGVDVNSIAVFTEAAPLENIVQRAGRACRRDEALQWCSENNGMVIIVGGSSKSGVYDRREVELALDAVASRLKRSAENIDWRLPCPMGGQESYTSLLAEVDRSFHNINYNYKEPITDLLWFFLANDGVYDFISELSKMKGWCGLVRNTIMMPILVDGNDYAVASLQWALSHADKILEVARDGVPILVGVDPWNKEIIEGPAVRLWEQYRNYRKATDKNCFWLLYRMRRDMETIAREKGSRRVALYRWAFKAKPDAYVPGKGFIVDLPEAKG